MPWFKRRSWCIRWSDDAEAIQHLVEGVNIVIELSLLSDDAKVEFVGRYLSHDLIG